MTSFTSQAARFGRVFVFALLPSILTITTGQSKLTIAAVAALVAPALEVAWRAIHPTTPATVATAPAPTWPPATKSDTSTPVEPWRPV